MTHRGPERSVLSRLRVTGLLLLLAVGLVATGFYGVFHTRYVGTAMSRMLGPFSDALAERGFREEEDTRIWGRMARRHEVVIVVEPADRPAFAFDSDGRQVLPDRAPTTPLKAVRKAADGSQATFYWTFFADGGQHLPLFVMLLLVVVAVVSTAFFYLQRQLLPLRRLQNGVDAVAGGDFSARLPVERNDEIGRVAESFNAMARRVGDMVGARERLLADVSHELRSPLTRMKVALELLPVGLQHDSLDRDLRQMETLIAVLLERESLRFCTDSGGLSNPVTVELAALATEVLHHFDAPVELRLPERRMLVEGDPDLLRLLLRNLVDNAVKFSLPDSQPPQVFCQLREDEIVLQVVDDGRGIPEGVEETLFEPFTKRDPARGHHLGYGLGLDLCRRISHLHGGDIRLLRRLPRGVEAVVHLPAAMSR